nr:iron-sulfur cluster biosynthesis family protein [uncultured Lactobacillus sp.]
MVKMTISQDAIDFLKKRGYNKHEILLIVDGGGGDYSIEGGSMDGVLSGGAGGGRVVAR